MDDAQVLAGMVLMGVMGRELQRTNGGDDKQFKLSTEQALCCGASNPTGNKHISGYKWMTKVKRQALAFLAEDRPVTKKARREAHEILQEMCEGYDDTDDEDVDGLDEVVALYEEEEEVEVDVEAVSDNDTEEEAEEEGEEEEGGEEEGEEEVGEEEADGDFVPNPADTSDGDVEQEDSDVEQEDSDVEAVE